MRTTPTSHNRVLVVDDDARQVGEYVRCLSDDFEPDAATETLTDLEKVLLGEPDDVGQGPRFEVLSCSNGDSAVEAIRYALAIKRPFATVFLEPDVESSSSGLDVARAMRELDPHLNIVLVTRSEKLNPDLLGRQIPPADKVFFFRKPLHGAECRQLAAALSGKWHADMALRLANEDLERRVEERTAALQKIAYFDMVTRLPNQLLLIEELKNLIAKAE